MTPSYKKIIVASLFTVFLMTLSGVVINEAFAETPELFTKIQTASEFNLPTTSSQDASSIIIDAEIVSVNISILDGDSIAIPLFDKTYTLTKEYIDTRDGGDFSWFGSNDLVSAIITVQENKLVATIHTPDGTFIVEPYTSDPLDDYHLIKNVDASRLVEFPHVDTTSISIQSTHHNDDYYRDNVLEIVLTHDRFRPSNLNDHDTVTVDVAVGWTTKLDDRLGGNTISNKIINEIDSANHANVASGIPVHFNLVYDEEIRYGLAFDNGEVSIEQDRDNLLNHTPGTIEDFTEDADIRDADIVILLTDPDDLTSYGGCGIAGGLIAKNPHDSIAIVVYDCFAGATFTHEMGHLFGAGHNRDTFGQDISPFGQFPSDGYGYYDVSAGLRTIMSYDCDSTYVDLPDKIPLTPVTCEPREVWSDPENDFFGTVTPTGDDNNYNARAIFGAGPYIASMQGGIEKYDSTPPEGGFDWFDEFIDKIFNQGQTMSIQASFNEAIHDGYPPTVTISDGTTTTDILMSKTSNILYATTHDLTTEEGTVTLEFSNAKDLYLNDIVPIAIGDSGVVTVIIPDNTPPVILLNGITPVDVEFGSVYNDAGVTGSDDVDGDISGSIVTVNLVNTSILGTYQVTYDVSDLAGNQAIQVIRTVNVVDTIPPVITVPVDVTFEATAILSPLNETDFGVATAIDVGDPSPVISNDAPTEFSLGDTTIIWTVTDFSENSSTDNQLITVQDTTNPIIALLGDNPQIIELGDSYTELGANAADNIDGDITIHIIIDSSAVDINAVGSYPVMYDVADSSGNSPITEFREVIVVQSNPTPMIISLVANDPDNIDDTYSRKDTITITFDSDTNMPGEKYVKRKPLVDDMFAFSESLGRAYSGKWVTPDTFVITIHSVNAASPPIIDVTTVTLTGIIPILSADELSEPSYSTSPALSGDFGIIP